MSKITDPWVTATTENMFSLFWGRARKLAGITKFLAAYVRTTYVCAYQFSFGGMITVN